MRQVMLVVQAETDEEADEFFADLVDMADQFSIELRDSDVRPQALDIFVADDLGTVSRP